MKYVQLMKSFIRREPLFRFKILYNIARIVMPEYRFKWPQLDWWDNEMFSHYLEQFDERYGMNTDRRWMLYKLLRLTENVPGDTAECGVFQGADSYIICQSNKQSKFERIHHMFDSFEGVSKPGDNDGDYWYEGSLACSVEKVKENLGSFNKIQFYKGWIPERFSEVENITLSFLHIDVDLYQPTKDSFAFFYPKMNEGGVIICDDYGFNTCPGATKAIDDFLQGKKEQMIPLSSGGGFLIKGLETGTPARL